MKLTNQVFILDTKGQSPFMASFINLMNQDLSLSKAMNVLGMSSQLDLRMERYGKLRMKLFKKYGTPTENDQIQVTPENVEKFMAEMNELNAMEFDLEGEVIDLTGEQVVLKAADLIRLKPLLSALPEIKLPDSEKVEDEEEAPAPKAPEAPAPTEETKEVTE